MNSSILLDTLSRILGDKPGDYYLAGLFFSCLGILIGLYHSSKKRDPSSPNTPENFSWIFLIWDNFKRVAMTLIVMFILFRIFDLSDTGMMISVGILCSLFLDKIIEYIISRSEALAKFMEMDRNKFPTKPPKTD